MCTSTFVFGHYTLKDPLLLLSKPNKAVYNSPKTFQPIVLSMFEKLIEKFIGKRL